MKKQFTFARLKNKDGSALLLTLIIFLVVIIVLMSSSMIALGNFNKSKATTKFSSSYNVSETGLKQYIEMLENYVRDNVNTLIDNPSSLATQFVSEYGNGNDYIEYDFETLMLEESKTKVSMIFDRQEGNTYFFKIESLGGLGDTQRHLMTELALTVSLNESGNAVIGIDIPAMMSINLDVSRDYDSFSFSGYRPKLEGPFITPNSAIKNNNGNQNWYGPFIFGGNLTNLGGLRSFNPIILYGDYINEGWSSEIDILMLMNLDSKVILETNGSVINYLFVPTNYNLNNIQIKSNAAINTYIKNIVYFNPNQFDPYDVSSYTSNMPSNSKIEALFGAKGTYPYDTYFDASFYLNHLDDPEIMDSLIPQYKLPDMPNLGSARYPWVSTTQTLSQSTNVTITDEVLDLGTSGASKLVLTSNFSVKSFKGSGSKTTTIDIGSRNIEILTESVDIGNNNTIELIGTGSLTFKVVGKNGYVEKFSFAPNTVIQRDALGGAEKHEPLRLRFIVGKTNKGNGNLTLTTANRSGTVDAIYLTQDMNLELYNKFHGVFVSLDGNAFHLSQSGNARMDGVIYMPNAYAKLENAYSGSLLVKEYLVTSSGFNQSAYDGSMTDKLIQDVMSFLEMINSGGNLGGSVGTSPGIPDENSLEFNTTPIREIGD